MDARLCDSSTMSRMKSKTCHIVRLFIKVTQMMTWVTVNIVVGSIPPVKGLDPQTRQKQKQRQKRLIDVQRS